MDNIKRLLKERAYVKLQLHTDEILGCMNDFVPPNGTTATQWLNVDQVINDIKFLSPDFCNFELIVYVYNILLWQCSLKIITREKLSEFITALTLNQNSPEIANYIISIHKNV